MNNLQKELISIRRQIHRNPELGNKEIQTTKYINSILKQHGIQTRLFKPTGLTGQIPAHKPGQKIRKCIGLRADIDALPILEKNNKPYCSRNNGVMHACGHDAHTAMLIGAGILLKQNEDELKKHNCAVKLIFQPDEEEIGGALRIIRQGALKNPGVDCIFGLHVSPEIPAGYLGFKYGQMMASSNKFEIEVFGGGGHGAYPFKAKDVIFAASEIIVSLKSLTQRKVHPAVPAVISACTVHSGTRPNIFPENAFITGTVRYLDKRLADIMPRIIEDVVRNKTAEQKLKYSFKYSRLCPVTENDNGLVESCIESARQVAGKTRISVLDKPSMGSEDFSEYMQLTPGCFAWLGARKHGSPDVLHHAEFDIDESVLITGSRYFARVVMDQIKK